MLNYEGCAKSLDAFFASGFVGGLQIGINDMFHRKNNFISDIIFSTKKTQLIFVKLDDIDTSTNSHSGAPNNLKHYSWLMQAAEWAECKWGYMRNFPGINKRIEIILGKRKYFYLVVYEDQKNHQHLVGTFSLTPNQIDIEKEKKFQKNKKYSVSLLANNKTINLSYFYVHDNFRELGFGTQMLEKAKQLSKAENMAMTAHLLTPNIHGFYKNRGATFVEEDRSLNEPCFLVHFDSMRNKRK